MPMPPRKNIHSMIEGGLFMSFTQNNREYIENILSHIEDHIIKPMTN